MAQETPTAAAAPTAPHTELVDAASDLADACEAVKKGWMQVCNKVAEAAQRGQLVQFDQADRCVGITVAEGQDLLTSLQEVRALLPKRQAPQTVATQ